jgi:hypothetical protein
VTKCDHYTVRSCDFIGLKKEMKLHVLESDVGKILPAETYLWKYVA